MKILPEKLFVRIFAIMGYGKFSIFCW